MKSTQSGRPFLLLTGATGMVGSLLLAELLRSSDSVAVLVRSGAGESAAHRVERLMQRLERRFCREFVRPVVLSGNLTDSELGLSTLQRRWLEDNCGRVVHSAANLSFRPAAQHPQNEPFRSNVSGTQNLLEVCRSAEITEWHYVSTAYVAGLRSGRVREDECRVGQEFANDYERSKCMVEESLRSCAFISSLTVYRPSIVIDSDANGVMAPDFTINGTFTVFEALSQSFGLPESGRWFPRLGFRGDERKNIVPADWVARVMRGIIRRPLLHGATYHLTSEHGTAISEIEDGFHRAVASSDVRRPRSLRPLQGSIEEIAAPYVAAFLPYFRDDPVFDRQNLEHALKTISQSPCDEINASEIADLAMLNIRRRGTPTDAGRSNVVEIRSWTCLLTDAHSCDEFGTNQSCHGHAASELAVVLSGPGGGQWVISAAADGKIRGIREGVGGKLRVCCSAKVWTELILGNSLPKDALSHGLLLIENESIGDVCELNARVSDLRVVETTEMIERWIRNIRSRVAVSRGESGVSSVSSL
jgi:thioester reductase-like protein